MEKITEEAYAALQKTPNGRRHPVTAAIQALLPGEILKIDAADWTAETKTPSIIVLREERRTTKKFEFNKRMDARGWVVKRLK